LLVLAMNSSSPIFSTTMALALGGLYTCTTDTVDQAVCQHSSC
jgi:hypothetical protein